MRFCLTPTTRMILLSICVLIFSTPLHATAQSQERGSSVRRHKDRARSVRFSSGQSSLKIPFELSNNFILLQVQVNDSRPLWFIFDTGASSSIINARLVKELKLQTKGNIGGSASGKAIEAKLISGVALSVPGVKVFNQPMASLPIDDLAPLVGRPIGGIIGYDFIREFLVEIDYAAKIINLYSPTSFKRSVHRCTSSHQIHKQKACSHCEN